MPMYGSGSKKKMVIGGGNPGTARSRNGRTARDGMVARGGRGGIGTGGTSILKQLPGKSPGSRMGSPGDARGSLKPMPPPGGGGYRRGEPLPPPGSRGRVTLPDKPGLRPPGFRVRPLPMPPNGSGMIARRRRRPTAAIRRSGY